MATTTHHYYAIQDFSGEYLRADGRWTPASDEARQFERRDDAVNTAAACGRATAAVVRLSEECDE